MADRTFASHIDIYSVSEFIDESHYFAGTAGISLVRSAGYGAGRDRHGVNLSMSLCISKSERSENADIIRMYEFQGIGVLAYFEMSVFNISFDTEFKQFETKTYKVENRQLSESDMLEDSVPLNIND